MVILIQIKENWSGLIDAHDEKINITFAIYWYLLACFCFYPKHLINSLLIKDNHSVCWKMPRGYWNIYKNLNARIWCDTSVYLLFMHIFFETGVLKIFLKEEIMLILLNRQLYVLYLKNGHKDLVKGTLLILNIDIMVVQYVVLLYSFAFLPTNLFHFF